jgi:preprotein translocase SecE subunit
MFDKISKVKKYLQETLTEVKKMNFISFNETMRKTFDVIFFSIFFLIIFSLVDTLFTFLILHLK